MAKRKPSEVICSFCLKTILVKEAYIVKLKMQHELDTLDGNVYYSPSCEKCLKSERIIGIYSEPKTKEKEE